MLNDSTWFQTIQLHIMILADFKWNWPLVKKKCARAKTWFASISTPCDVDLTSCSSEYGGPRMNREPPYGESKLWQSQFMASAALNWRCRQLTNYRKNRVRDQPFHAHAYAHTLTHMHAHTHPDTHTQAHQKFVSVQSRRPGSPRSSLLDTMLHRPPIPSYRPSHFPQHLAPSLYMMLSCNAAGTVPR